MRLALISTKGGTGKTTSAVYLATALHRIGRTLLVDADPQLSALTWSQQALRLEGRVAMRRIQCFVIGKSGLGA